MKYLVDIFRKNDGVCTPISIKHDKMFPTNISITNHNGSPIYSIRFTNYCYVPFGGFDRISIVPVHGINSDSVLVRTPDSNIGPEFSPITLRGTDYPMFGNIFRGLEDLRLISWNGTLYGIGYRPDIQEGRVMSQLVEFDDNMELKRTWFLDTGVKCEKNWQPIEDHPFTFMYSPATGGVLHLEPEKLVSSTNPNLPSTINKINAPEFNPSLSGSSQLIKLSDGRYISIVHASNRWMDYGGNFRWSYSHFFMVYNQDLQRIAISCPFNFVESEMEFTLGMAKIGTHINITFSVYDGTTHELAIPEDRFMEVLNGLLTNDEKFEGPAPHTYMVESFESGKIIGVDQFTYIGWLECANLLNDISGIDGIIDNIGAPDWYKIYMKNYITAHHLNKH